jgi:hypothetical protein
VLLRADTRVTNHGYKNGRATSIQVVLQAGTAVLVDEYGKPVTKCYCGNPLTSPVASDARYYGPRWTDFDPVNITVVIQNTVIIQEFTLTDTDTGETFGRPAGSTGDDDGPPPDGGTPTSKPKSSSTTTTTTAPAEPSVTNEDLIGTWEFNADVVSGNCKAYNGSFDVAVSGPMSGRTITLTFLGTQSTGQTVSGTLKPDNSFSIEAPLSGGSGRQTIAGSFIQEGALLVIDGTSTLGDASGTACELSFSASKV